MAITLGSSFFQLDTRGGGLWLKLGRYSAHVTREASGGGGGAFVVHRTDGGGRFSTVTGRLGRFAFMVDVERVLAASS